MELLDLGQKATSKKQISGPNENSQKASISVNVLAAGSQDWICENEQQNQAREKP